MKTIRELELGEVTIRLVETKEGYGGAVIAKTGSVTTLHGSDPDALWENLKREAGKAGESYFGYDGAKTRFSRMFPEGFESAAYISRERAYKAEASEYLRMQIPLETAPNASDVGELALKAFRDTNLLAPIEKARVQELCRSRFADSFVQGAAKFTLGSFAEGIAQMKQATADADIAHWTVLTYLPYLWRPEEHMFLKPAVTRDFAARVGHTFAHQYSSELDVGVYESLLNLTAETKLEVNQLGPADNIDIQSFIWIVGRYDAADEADVIEARDV